MTSAMAYAVLAGSQDNPTWWRVPLASSGLATLGCIGAFVASGTARIALIVVAVIFVLPAALYGLVIAVVASLPGRIHSGGDDSPEEPAMVSARRRVRQVTLAVLVLAAAVGVALYASNPGVASYQASSLLVFPLVIVVLVRLHRWLPSSVERLLAIILALAGCAGYVLVGDAQWWNWGQYAILPLVLLLWWEAVKTGGERPASRWYGGFRDGPWGPP
jgi:hypothetical protein